MAILACADRPRPREVLADLLWEERVQVRALSNLRGELSGLRKHLGPYVAITRYTTGLDPDDAEVEEKLSAGQVGE
jgi:DNA-binding SARP family transcriptional activator